jgi:acetyltransferase-like isoleucine patch superfamily enzyme
MKLKTIGYFFISLLPLWSSVRAGIARFLLNKNIEVGSKLGFCVILDVRNLVMKNQSKIESFVIVRGMSSLVLNSGSIVRRFVSFNNVDEIILEEKSVIGNRCSVAGPSKIFAFTKRKLILGKQSVLTSKHLIDVCDCVSIGSNVVIAGRHSEIWTHHFDLNRNRVQSPVSIGDNVYIGSSSIIGAGVNIVSNSVIAGGSRIFADIEESGYVWSTNSKPTIVGKIKKFDDLGYQRLGKYDDILFLQKIKNGDNKNES